MVELNWVNLFDSLGYLKTKKLHVRANHTENPQRVVNLATSFFSDWISTNEQNKETQEKSEDNHIYRWIAPPFGLVKSNIDAAFFDDIKSTGVSMVIRDDEGKFLSA